MIRHARHAALALALALGACSGGSNPFAGGEGASLDAQVVHPAGVVVQTRGIRSAGERTLVTLLVMNGRDREIRLASGNERTFLLTDSGEKLLLVPALTNAGLAVPPGKAMDAALVFAGTLPGSGRATLVINENGSADSSYTTSPKFEVTLPLDGASGGDVPDSSALSNMANLPQSRIGPAQAGGSSFGQSGNATSTLETAARLRTELGAVEEARGTVVSLPGDVTFDFDKASIQADAQPKLQQLAELAKIGGAGPIRIEGHTDAKGDDAYNKRLSEQRADAVKAFLAEQGIAADRMQTIGLGELRPVAPNADADGGDDEAGRARNRRVEVILPKAG